MSMSLIAYGLETLIEKPLTCGLARIGGALCLCLYALAIAPVSTPFDRKTGFACDQGLINGTTGGLLPFVWNLLLGPWCPPKTPGAYLFCSRNTAKTVFLSSDFPSLVCIDPARRI